MPTKYAQLAASLRSAIAAGDYRATNRLPTEQQLMEIYARSMEPLKMTIAV